MSQKEKVLCFTGHREIPVELFKKLFVILPGLLEEYILEGYTVFKAGGALGFDMLCEIAILELKKTYPKIQLHLILPCPEQASEWSQMDQRFYNAILKEADSVRYTSNKFAYGCMSARNREIVNGSDLCVAFLRSGRGGTKYTVDYAKKQGVPVVNLYDKIRSSNERK